MNVDGNNYTVQTAYFSLHACVHWIANTPLCSINDQIKSEMWESTEVLFLVQ